MGTSLRGDDSVSSPTARAESDVDDRPERLFGLAVWLACSAGMAIYIAVFGRNVPYMEDWELVPALVGKVAFGPTWLFEQTVEHRYILAKALLYPVWVVSRGDFRSATYLDAIALIGLAYVSLRIAGALRGRASFADAFFPVALLHLGHHENLIFFSQLCFVAPVLILMVVMIVVATGRWRSRSGAIALATCIVLLPFNGAIGILLLPPLAAWTLYAALSRKVDRTMAIGLSCVVGLAIVSAGLYFVGYHTPVQTANAAHSVGGILKTSLEVLSVALGPGGSFSGKIGGLAVGATCGAVGVALVRVAWKRAEERQRALGMLACLLATGLVVAGIGIGRASLGPGAGFPSRYSLLAVPALLCVFYATILYGTAGTGRFVQAALAACALALVGPNLETGLDYGRFRVALEDGVLDAVRAGVPPAAIAQRFSPELYPNRVPMAERLDWMRQQHVGPYKGAPDAAFAPTPTCREVDAPLTVVEAHDATVNGSLIHSTGPDPYVVYALPAAEHVCGARLDYSVDTADGSPASTQIFWALSSREDFVADGRNMIVQTPPGLQQTTAWIYGDVDRIRIDPHIGPCTMRLVKLTLTVEVAR